MKSVVFCSSQRFKSELEAFTKSLREEARTQNLHVNIFEPNFETRPDNLHLAAERDRMKDGSYRETIAGMVYDHLFRKVRGADVWFIFNKDGYLGANTNGELFAA